MLSSGEKKEKEEKVEEHLSFLNEIKAGNKEFLIYDLLGSAKRCADLEKKYDDAVARLYRVLEKIAQVALEKRGINDSDVKPEQIPEGLRDEFIRISPR